MGSGLIGSADESSEILASPHTGHHATDKSLYFTSDNTRTRANTSAHPRHHIGRHANHHLND